MAPQSNSLVSVCSEDSVRFWDVKDLTRPGKAPKPSDATHFETPVAGTCWNSRGEVVVTLLSRGGPRITMTKGINYDSKPSPEEMSKVLGSSTSLSISPSNKFAVAGTDRGQILVWELTKMVVVRELKQHQGAITSVQWSPWSQYQLASASVSGEVLFHHIKDREGSNVSMARSGTTPKLGLSFSPTDKNILTAAGQDGTVSVFDTGPQFLLSSSRLHRGPVTGLCHLRETLYSVGREDRELVASDPRAPTSSTSRRTLSRTPACVAARADGRMLGVGCQDGHLLLYDTRKASEPVADILAIESGAALRCVSFQPSEAASAASTPEPVDPRATSSWMAAAGMSPMPVGGVSPLGAGASTFTPMRTGGLLASTGLPGTSSRKEKLLTLDRVKTQNQAAAQEAAKLYSAKPPTPGPAPRRRLLPQDEPLRALGDQARTRAAVEAAPPPSKATAAVDPQSRTLSGEGKENMSSGQPEVPPQVSVAEKVVPRKQVPEPEPEPEPAPVADSPETAGARQETGGSLGQVAVGEGTSGTQQRPKDVSLEGLRDDIRNMHIELIRQFHDHQTEMAEAFRFIIKRQDALAEEVAQLRQQLQPCEQQRRDPWF